jgi:hypothetical protein
MKTAVILSPKNAAAIAKYSKSVGWTETELANHLLNETLSDGRFDLNVQLIDRHGELLRIC